MSDRRGAWRIGDSARLAIGFAWRSCIGAPWNTLAVIVTLAAAVGAYQAVDAVRFAVAGSGLPYREVGTLVRIAASSEAGVELGREHLFRREVALLREEARSFAWIGHWTPGRMFLGEERARVVAVATVDPGLLTTLGARPAEGRLFTAPDHQGAGRLAPEGGLTPDHAQPVVVLSHDFRVSALGGSGAAVGSELVLDGKPVRVIGVMPPGFFFPDGSVEAWLPAPEYRPAPRFGTVIYRNAPTVARLREGVTAAAAGAEITAILQSAGLRPPEQRAQVTPFVDALTSASRPALAILWAGALVLVIAAAASVAGLRLARARAERRVTRIRHCFGASRGDEIAAALARVALLGAAVAAGAGLAAAAVAPLLQNTLVSWPGLGGSPRWATGIPISFGSVALAEVVSLPESWTRNDRRRGAFPLAVGLSTATVVLIAAATLGGSAWALLGDRGGYSSDRLAQLTVDFGGAGEIRHEAKAAALARLADRIAAMPEVEGAAYADTMPDAGSGQAVVVTPRGGGGATEALRVRLRAVGPRFLELLGIPVVEGRGLQESDAPPAAPVAVADRLVAAQSGVGAFLPLGDRNPRIVGVLPRIAVFPSGESPPTVYRPYATPPVLSAHPNAEVVARFRAPPERGELARLAELPRTVDPALRTLGVASVRERRLRTLGHPVLAAAALGIFAVAAILLAAAGAMGQVADDAARRSRSLALRAALGAPPDALAWETLRRTARAAAIGLGAGCLLGFLVVRFIGNRVAWVESGDPLLVLGPAALLALLVLACGAAVALRAARRDPWETLRSL